MTIFQLSSNSSGASSGILDRPIGVAMELALPQGRLYANGSGAVAELFGTTTTTILDELLRSTNKSRGGGAPFSSTATPTSSNGSQSPDEPSALDKFSATYQGVHGYFSVAVCVFGIISNLLNIIVLTRKHMRSPTNFLLTALAIADMLTMSTYPIFAVYLFILKTPQCYMFHPHTKSWIYFILFHNLFIQMCHTVAMWLTVSLAVFRYIFVCRHTIAPTWCSMFRAKLTVVIVTTAAILVFTPHFFLYQVMDNNLTDPAGRQCRWWIMPSQFAKDHPVYDKFLTSVFGAIMKIAPCILLAFLSGLLIHAMQRAKKRRARLLNNISRVIDSDGSSEHNRTTMMMVAVVLCFVITETPQGILALWAAAVDDGNFFKDVYVKLGDLMDILVLINSAVNFILYCIMSQQFRDTFKSLFVAKHVPFIFQRLVNNKHNQQHNNHNNHHHHQANGNEYCSVKTETTHV